MEENKKEQFSNLLIEISNNNSLNTNTSREYLSNKNIDVDLYLKTGLGAIKKFQAKQKLEQAKNRKSLMERARKIFTDLKEDFSSNNPKELALKLFGDKNVAYQGFFSNIEDFDDMDALNMINNTQLLEIISRLEQVKKEDE